MLSAGSFVHEPAGYDCPYCRLQGQFQAVSHGGVFPETVVYHSSLLTAVVSGVARPQSQASLLVFPNAHYENLYTLPLSYALPLQWLVRELALALKTHDQCAGITIMQQNEPAGNQSVWHYHTHVLPRMPDDQFYQTKPIAIDRETRVKRAQSLRVAIHQQILAQPDPPAGAEPSDSILNLLVDPLV